MLTFIFLMLGGIYGLRLALRARRRGLATLWFAFYVTFSIFLLLTGMEEISWGQWFFHFHTPEAIARINTQQEFTLHNLKGLGGHTVWLRLAFGVGGLVGIALWFVPFFRKVAASPKLTVWFAVITVFAIGDLVSDFVGPRQVAALFDVMSEVNELLIAAAGCLYLWLNSKHLLGPPAERP
jgi:Ca2+/Na+ antiporter